MKTRTRLLAALLVLIALFSCACGSGGGGPKESADDKIDRSDMTLEVDETDHPSGGAITVGLNAETNGWDALSNQFSQAGSLAMGTVVETLGVVNRDGEAEDWLATSFAPSADLRSWDVTLRRDVTYHDGTPMDAANLKANIDTRMRRSATKRSGVENNITGAIVLGDHTVRIELREPHAQLDVQLANLYMESTAGLNDQAKQQIAPVGTGPFVFSEWVQNARFVVKANPNYWRRDPSGRRLPFLQSIEFRPIPDEETRVAGLRSGTLDMAMLSTAPAAKGLDEDFTVLRDFTHERTFIMLNTTEGPQNAPNPFTNEHARKALAYATNRQALADLAGAGVQSTSQPYRPGDKWALPGGDDGYYPFDLDKAREEVAAYKRETGRPTLSFELLTSGSDGIVLLQAVQAQWRDADIGIDASIRQVDQAALIITGFTGTYTALPFRWFGQSNPELNTPFIDGRQGTEVGALSLDLSRYSSASSQRALTTLQGSPNFEDRRTASTEVWRELNRAAVFIWLYDSPWSMAARPGVRGLNRWRNFPLTFNPKPGWFGEVWLAA